MNAAALRRLACASAQLLLALSLVPAFAEAPAQIMPSLFVVPEVSATETDGVGSGFTVMTCVAVAEQLLAFVTVTV